MYSRRFVLSIFFLFIPFMGWAADTLVHMEGALCSIVTEFTQGVIPYGIAVLCIVGMGIYVLKTGASNLGRPQYMFLGRIAIGLAVILSSEMIVNTLIIGDANCDDKIQQVRGTKAVAMMEEFYSGGSDASGCDGYGSCGWYRGRMMRQAFDQIIYDNPEIIDNLGAYSQDHYHDFFETWKGSGPPKSFRGQAMAIAESEEAAFRADNPHLPSRSQEEEDHIIQAIVDALTTSMLARSAQFTP